MLTLAETIEVKLWFEELLQDARRQIEAKGQTASGRTAEALRYELSDEAGTFYGPGYIETLEFGRGPTTGGGGGGTSLRERIRQWIDDKGIEPEGISKDSLAFLIARKIHAEGTVLYRSGTPSGTFSEIITPERVEDLKKRLSSALIRKVSSAFLQ